MSRRSLLFAALLSALAYAGGIGLTISSGWLITMASEHPPILTLTVAIVGVRFFGISRSAFRYAERLMSHKSVFDSLTRIRAQLFQIVSHQPITSMRWLLSGSFAKTVVDDVERSQEYQLRDVLPALSAYVAVGLGTTLAVLISPATLYFTVPVGVIFFLIIPALTRSRIYPLSQSLEGKESELSTLMSISQAELDEARMYGYVGQVKSIRLDQVQDITTREKKIFTRVGWMQALTLGSLGGALVASTVIARSLQNPPIVRITMTVFIPLVIYEAVTAWYPGMFGSGKLLRAQQSVDEISKLEVAHEESEKAPVGSSLRIFQASASWGEAFMKGVDAEATPGSPLLITGENGVGKSTLALGISGLLPYQGSIIVSEHEISTVPNREAFVVGALQQSHIFNTSVRENLKIANEGADDDRLHHVLKLVELEELSLDEILGEFGRTLSGGEAKRLSVARALLSDSPVVILDEPLEHIDSQRASRIESSILDAVKERTLVVIAHSGWASIKNTLHLQK